MISLTKFKSLIPMQLLDKLAINYSVNADNNVRLPGQTVFLCLLNGLLNHPTLTQRMLEEHYNKMTGRSCDHSSFGKRLARIDSGYFRAVFEHLYGKLASVATKTDLQTLKMRIIIKGDRGAVEKVQERKKSLRYVVAVRCSNHSMY